MADPLDEAALLEAARAQVPDADFGDEGFRPALTQLLTSLRDEAQLDARGTWSSVTRVLSSLVKRRRLAQLHARHPELRTRRVPPPIFILGFPRTGTTLLHNLLACDPNKRAIRLWEMREPFAPEPTPPDWTEGVISSTTRLVDAAYKMSPELAAIHPLRATWPDECSWLFRNSFTSMVVGFTNYVPSYLRWLEQHDMRGPYREFEQQLAAITFQRPGAPLVLKDPCHIWHLDILLEQFPDARVIQLHRDVTEVVPSFCSLVRALHEASAPPRPLAEVGSYALDMLTQGMTRMLAARAAIDSAPSATRPAILDLDYRELVRDPLATVAGIHAHFDLPLTDTARTEMARWLDDNRGLSGGHRYTLASFGLDRAHVQARLAAYTDRFAPLLERRGEQIP